MNILDEFIVASGIIVEPKSTIDHGEGNHDEPKTQEEGEEPKAEDQQEEEKEIGDVLRV